MRTHEERSALTARWLACGLALLCASSVAQGAVVNLQTGPRAKNNTIGFRLVCYPDSVTPAIGTITPPPPAAE